MKSFVKIFVVTALLFTLACQKANNTEVSALTQLQAQAPEFKIEAGHSSQAFKTIKVKSLAEAKKVLQELQEFSKHNRDVTTESRNKRLLMKQAPLLNLNDRNVLRTRDGGITGSCGGSLESGVISSLNFSVFMYCSVISSGRQGGVSKIYENFSIDGVAYSTPTEVLFAANSLSIGYEDNAGICYFGGNLYLGINLEISNPEDPDTPPSIQLVTFSFLLEGYWNAQGGGGCNVTYS